MNLNTNFLIINQLDALISQIYFGRKLNMFRTVPLSIIGSFSLYTQQWYISYSSADSLRAGSGWNLFWEETLHVSDSSSVHLRDFFTVHTAVVYVIQVCSRQLSSRIRTFRLDPAPQLSANLYDIYHCCVYSEKLPMMGGGTVRNM